MISRLRFPRRRRPAAPASLVVIAGLTLAAVSPPVREGDLIRFGRVTIDARARVASLPVRVNMTNGIVEYAVVTENGKTHESVLVTDAEPEDVQAALLLLGGVPATTPWTNQPALPPGPRAGFELRVSWNDPHAADARLVDLADLVGLGYLETRTANVTTVVTGRLAPGPWLFTGSRVTSEGFAARFEGSVVSLITDPSAILHNPGPDRDDDDIHVPDAGRLPRIGTTGSLRFRLVDPAPARQPRP